MDAQASIGFLVDLESAQAKSCVTHLIGLSVLMYKGK